jgi:ABC-type Fe3+-hydroxamate transport system substrate-binding protein
MKLTCFFVFLLFSLNICLQAQPESKPSQRIISLAPSLTTMLYLLGNQDNIIGCTTYCEEAVNDKKSIVASAIEVNVEKVFVLKPDIVVATTLTKPATIESFKKLGINVKVLPTPKSFTEICNQLMQLAAITGKQEYASEIINQQNRRLNKLQQLIPNIDKQKVFFQIGANPLFTVIPNTFMDDFITYSGGINVASELKSGTISRESVVIKNPDVIFIVTMGIAGPEEKSVWEKFKNISASQNGKIFIIDSNKACSPTPVAFVDVVEQMVSLMY